MFLFRYPVQTPKGPGPGAGGHGTLEPEQRSDVYCYVDDIDGDVTNSFTLVSTT